MKQLFSEIEALGNRTAFSNSENRARLVIAREMKRAGLDVLFDSAGNMFGMYTQDRGQPYVAFGSHIDSVPNGGNYDGLVGIIASIKAFEQNRNKGEPLRNTLICAFSCEESSLFGEFALGSKFFTGAKSWAELAAKPINEKYAYASINETFGQLATDTNRFLREHAHEYDLTHHDFDFANANEIKISEFFEPHIEQGPTLLDRGADIGNVTAIAAAMRWDVEIDNVIGGQHSGTTPFEHRRDAQDVAYSLRKKLYDMARDEKNIVSNVIILPHNQAVNTVTPSATLKCELRSVSQELNYKIYSKFRKLTEAQAANWNFRYAGVNSSNSLTVREELIDKIKKAALANGLREREMISGAGHDAMIVDAVTQNGATVIFIPHGNYGISHNSNETCDAKDINSAVKMARSLMR